MKVKKFILNNSTTIVLITFMLIALGLKFFSFSNSGLFFFIFMIAVLVRDLVDYRKHWKLLQTSRIAILNKNQFNIATLLFPIFIASFTLEYKDFYTYAAIAFSFGSVILHLITKRRRIIVFHENSIEDLGGQSNKKVDQISSFQIFKNNIEIVFNKKEVLQINKNELLIPDWSVFANRMKEYKELLPKDQY